MASLLLRLRLHFLAMLALLVLAACGDEGPTGSPGSATLTVNVGLGLPVSAGPDERLTVVARRVGGAVLGSVELDLAAGTRGWSVSIPSLDRGAQVALEASIRPRAGGEVLWSGEATILIPAGSGASSGAGGGGTAANLLLRAGDERNVGVTTITIQGPGLLVLDVGESRPLAYSVSGGPDEAAVVRSSDPAVVRVENGVLQGVAPGQATVQILAGFHLAQLQIQVPEPLASIDLAPDTLRLSSLGAAETLAAQGRTASGAPVPIPGHDPAGGSPVLTWTSSDTLVARVDARGQVEAVGPGAASISATFLDNPTVMGTAQVQVRPLPSTVEIVAGDLQEGVVGQAAPILPRVRVLDAGGAPVAGARVTFQTDDPGAEVSGASVVASAGGEASPGGWQLGTVAGEQSLNVRAAPAVIPGVSAPAPGEEDASDIRSVRVRAQALPGAPARLVALSPLAQTVTAGGEISALPTVRVEDAFENPVPGAAVSFAFLAGPAGTLDPTQAVAGPNGVAFVSGWVPGSSAGVQRVAVSSPVDGVEPLVFSVTVQPAALAELVRVSGHAQTGVTGDTLPEPPVVRAQDAFGNPLAGVEVVFAPAEGSGSVVADTVLTSPLGEASSVGWVLGPVAGPQTLVATAVVGDASIQVEFTATATAGEAASLSVVAGDEQTAPAGSVLPVAPAVRVTDALGNPVAGVEVTFAVGSGGGSVAGAAPTTGADGVATSGPWTLGPTLGANTLTASAAGEVVTLNAVAVAGVATALVQVAGADQTAPVETTLPIAPRIRLEDALGNPVEGAEIVFSITSGGGSVAGAVQTTDAAGEAEIGSWTLGSLGVTNRLQAAAGALTTTFEALAQVPCLALAVGQAYTTTLEGAAELCFEGGLDGAEYTWIPANASASPLSLTVEGTGVIPVAGPPSPFVVGRGSDLLEGPSVAGSPLAGVTGYFERFGDASGSLSAGGGYTPLSLDEARGRALASADDVASPLIVPGVPTLGDVWELNVAPSCEGPRVERSGTVRVIGSHVIVVTDNANPGGGYSPADLQDLADEADGVVYPAVTGAFGVPTDADSNGRVVLFVTSAVNPDLTGANINLGFVRSDPRDLLASADCARSNEGEILYLAAPDPAGDVTFTPVPVEVALSQSLRGVARELRNVVGASVRLSAGSAEEEPWLTAGLNAVAEELAFYAASGDLAPGMNLGGGDFPLGPRATALNRYGVVNISLMNNALGDPEGAAPLRSTGPLPQADVGLSWAFLRYAADRAGGSQSAFWASLVNTPLTGRDNLSAAIGADVDLWYRDFLASIYVDDVVAGLDPAYVQPSWDFRDFFLGLTASPINLAVTPLTDGIPASLSLAGDGGSAFVRFGVGIGETGTVTTLSGGTAPTSSEPVIVIRTR